MKDVKKLTALLTIISSNNSELVYSYKLFSMGTVAFFSWL